MNMGQSILTLLAAGVVATGCAKKEEPPAAPAAPAVDLAAEEAAIRSRSAEWMNFLNAKDAASIRNVYTADATTIYDGSVRRGDAVVASAEKNFADNPNEVVSWTTDSVRLAQSGDLAIEFGTLRTDLDGAEGKEPATDGAFVTIWMKTADGWRVLADAGTQNEKKDDAAN
ncbi:MAG: nuclear transport factor 2 family protein [Gammaproteobacteria bacterium]|nr:nuclear transport factor 2 family protein [Gammaproteobacteria bacterium]